MGVENGTPQATHQAWLNTPLRVVLAMCLVVALAVGAIGLFSLRHYFGEGHGHRQRCANNIHMMHIAIHDYAIDHNLTNGAAVTLQQLAPNYIRRLDDWRCPSCRKFYGTNFVVGQIPVCPGNVKNHVWKQIDLPNL